MDNIAMSKTIHSNMNEDFYHIFKNTPISSQMAVSIVSSGKLFNKTSYYCRDRKRNDYLLLLTIGGKAWVKEGSRKKTLQKGSWFLLRPNLIHSYCDITPWSFAYVHFHGRTIDQVINRLSFFKNENLDFRQSSGNARELLDKLLGCASDAAVSGEITRNALLLELLARLHHDYRKSSNTPDPFTIILEYMIDNLEQDIELSRLAEIAGMSPFHFNRRFKEKYGYPPIRFIRKLRMEKAKKLLSRVPSELKIYEIAEMCGFNDPLYFSRAFRQWTDMSPEAFRIRAVQGPSV